VSEYQYYDFKAIDHALTKTEMIALRAISTRAVITTTSFTNHYEWGDLKADPHRFQGIRSTNQGALTIRAGRQARLAPAHLRRIPLFCAHIGGEHGKLDGWATSPVGPEYLSPPRSPLSTNRMNRVMDWQYARRYQSLA
jgi:hypothetical protein